MSSYADIIKGAGVSKIEKWTWESWVKQTKADTRMIDVFYANNEYIVWLECKIKRLEKQNKDHREKMKLIRKTTNGKTVIPRGKVRSRVMKKLSEKS